MKLNILILLSMLMVACSTNTKKQSQKGSNENNTSNRTIVQIDESDVQSSKEFDIEIFRLQADSLLKALKGKQYSFELSSDTFDFRSDNPEFFTKGHGIYWLLYRYSSASIVRHYLYVPNTRKQLRIYLAEAKYRNKNELHQTLAELESVVKRSNDASDHDVINMKLSPTHDYIMSSDTQLYWMNLSYPYNNKEVLRFISCLKNNVDSTKVKGEIICLYGSDCSKTDVP